MDKMGSIVYNGIADGTAIHGDLFQGQKFFFSQRVPSRKHFVEQVEVRHPAANSFLQQRHS